MAENGVNGNHGPNQPSGVQWRVGIMNSSNKYLTAESFGKVNASAGALKKKQIWCIEQDPVDKVSVYIRTGTGRYLTTEKLGKVLIDEEERSDDGKFTVEYSKDGRWYFKNALNGWYLKGAGDSVACFDKVASNDNCWSIQLYVHPQIHLLNVHRKRYAHLNPDTNELQCSELIPWGSDSLIFLDFVEGRYTLRTFNNQFLTCDGSLQENADDNTKFFMEIQQGCLAFKDVKGRYLSTAGGKGAFKGKSVSIPTKDELFTIEDSHPQCQIISPQIGKAPRSVSVKQGVDVTANQPTDEIEDTEIFQMEYNKGLAAWAFRASTNCYWELQTGAGTVQAHKKETTANSFFKLDWQEDGTVRIQGPDGKYLSNKPTGILYSDVKSQPDVDTNKFKLILVNRPSLVLKCDVGFVAAGINGQLFYNKAKYDILKTTADGNGGYTLQGEDGKYWTVGNDSMIYADDAPTKFQFQFCGGSMMAIRAPNGCYLKQEQNGNIKASASEIDSTSLWEF